MVDWKDTGRASLKRTNAYLKQESLGRDLLKTGGTALVAYIIGELLKDSTAANAHYLSEAIDVAKDLSVALLTRKGLQDINHNHLNGSDITDKVIDAGTFGLLGVEMLDNMAESYSVRDFGRFLGLNLNETLNGVNEIISKYGNKLRLAFSLGHLIKPKLEEAY